MKRILLITFLISTVSVYAQHGPVNAVDFNGTSDYIEIPDDPSLNPTNKFTVEAWINADSWATNSWQNTIVSKDQWTSISEGWVIRCGSNGVLSFNLALNSNGAWYEVTSSPLMSTNKWYHVAGTYDGSIMRLYLNGKQVGTFSQTGTITATTAPVKIGNIAMSGQSRFFDGEIDEVRIWNEVLSANTLRQYMCQKVDGNHPNLPDLTAHYTLNSGAGSSILDVSGNGLNGTKSGGAWTVSGVPLGDESGFIYNSNWSGKSFIFGHHNGDSILISNLSGNPDGAHIYYVDAPPNFSTPPAGVVSFSLNRYYGVFLTAGTSPSYKLTFDYNGFPGIINQADLNLNYRTNNSDANWQTLNATIDTIQKTMIKTNSSAGEFVIGFNDALTSFDLHSPASASTFNIQGMSNQTVPFDWFSSKLLLGGGADYKWYLDYDTSNFQNPIAVKNSASGGTDTLVGISFGDLGNYMTSAGVYYGETLKARWTVKAVAGPVEKFANQSRTIDFVRGILSTDAIFNFLLSTPDSDTLVVYNGGSTTKAFTWIPSNSTAGPNVTYEVQIAGENGSFSSPLGTFTSDNNGLDTVANITDADLATMLQNASIPNDVQVKFKWRTVASIGSLSKASLDSHIIYIERMDDPTIGISENIRDEDVDIFPNPVRGHLTIRMKNSDLYGTTAILYNSLGKEVLIKSIKSNSSLIEIPSSIKSGMYLLKLTTPRYQYTRKIQIAN